MFKEAALYARHGHEPSVRAVNKAVGTGMLDSTGSCFVLNIRLGS